MIGLAMMLAAAYPNSPIARGPTASVEAVTRAARRCGMRDIRFDPLDQRRAMLLIGKTDSYKSVDCTLQWMKRHNKQLNLEPLFIGNMAPS